MHKIFLALCLARAVAAGGQTVLMEVDVAGDTVPQETGRNLKRFVHTWMGYGLVAGGSERGAAVSYGSSASFEFGFRYKRKLGSTFSAGYDLAYRSVTYVVKQQEGKVLPDTVRHDRERFNAYLALADIYLRIGYGRRGNYIGRFIDVGADGGWVFAFTHFARDKMPDGSFVRTTTGRMGVENTRHYGLLMRAGFNRWVFTGHYRLSDVFRPSAAYPELPRLLLGIQVGFH